MNWTVEIEYDDHNDTPNTDLHGNYKTREKAAEEADKLNARFDKLPDSLSRSVRANPRPLVPLRVREIMKEAREWMEDDGSYYNDDNPEISHGMYSIDHSGSGS